MTNSTYAEVHKRVPKTPVNFRLDSQLVKWVDDQKFENKSSFYVEAVKSAIKKAKRKEKEL